MSLREPVVTPIPIAQLRPTQMTVGFREVEAKQRAWPVDAVLVIDTTGSMGDEIRYLDTEFDAITKNIQARYPNDEQHWSLVA